MGEAKRGAITKQSNSVGQNKAAKHEPGRLVELTLQASV